MWSSGFLFLVRHDFVAFHTFVKFLTHRLAFCVGSTVVGIALISSEYSVTCTALSPYCFLRGTHTTLCETTFAYVAAAMFLFRIVPFHPFQTSIALSKKARDRSDEVKVIFIVIEINLFFSPWSFVDDGVEMFGWEDDDLVVVNHFLEFGQLPEFHRDPPGHQPSDAVADRVTAVLYAPSANWIPFRILIVSSNISHYSAGECLCIVYEGQISCYPGT